MMKQRKSRRLVVVGFAGFLTLVIVGLGFYFFTRIQNGVLSLNEGTQLNTLSEPVLKIDEFITGISQPVDMIFPNPELMIYGTKDGTLTTRVTSTNQTAFLAKLPEIVTDGERGLQSLAVDREFFENRYIYACYSANSPDRGQEIRVSRFMLSTDTTKLTDRIDILTGVASVSNRNQGCALGMDALGYLWVAIGDTGNAGAPQDPKNLTGKVLRILRDGNPVEGNLSQPFDPRIFSFGHRNPIGMTLLESPLLNGAYGYMTERGGVRDDEINQLVSGNFGWDPNIRGVYVDSSQMTDLRKYSNAVRSLWSFGSPVNEIAGIERLGRKRWQAWQGQLLVTTERPGATKLIELATDGSYKSEKAVFPEYPQLRNAVESPDGTLYLATANDSQQDKIIRVQVICTVCD